MFKTVAVAQLSINLSDNNQDICWNQLTDAVRGDISKKVNEEYQILRDWEEFYPPWVKTAIDVIRNKRGDNITFSRVQIEPDFKVCVIDGGDKYTENERYFSVFAVLFTQRSGRRRGQFNVPGSR